MKFYFNIKILQDLFGRYKGFESHKLILKMLWKYVKFFKTSLLKLKFQSRIKSHSDIFTVFNNFFKLFKKLHENFFKNLKKSCKARVLGLRSKIPIRANQVNVMKNFICIIFFPISNKF